LLALTTMALYRSYIWSYRIEVPPYERLPAILEAFFASYPGGDYDVEERDRYKLSFRRGLWRKSLLGMGPRVPDRLPTNQFSEWPLIVRLLVRPAPDLFTVTIRYEVYLPRPMTSLNPETQTAVDLHARKELADLVVYLAQCLQLEATPDVVALD
jgi:hypothetical protein